MLARAARRSKRRFGGALEPFALLNVELAPTRGELGGLLSAQVTRAFPVILRDLARMSVAGTALSLVRQVVPERVPDPELFDLTLSLLEALDRSELAPWSLLAAFRVQVMVLAGFAPRLQACGRCGKRPAPGRAAEFDPAHGYLVCQACGGARCRLSAGTRQRLLNALSQPLTSAAAMPPVARELDEAERAMTAFIEYRLERRLDASSSAPAAEATPPKSPDPTDEDR